MIRQTALSLMILLAVFSCSDDPSHSTPCGVRATVKDLSGLDGCGFVFELEDGTRLEPERIGYCGTPPLPKEALEDPLFNFEFIDGKKVYIDFEITDGASICMAGQMVKITCLTEARMQSE